MLLPVLLVEALSNALQVKVSFWCLLDSGHSHWQCIAIPTKYIGERKAADPAKIFLVESRYSKYKARVSLTTWAQQHQSQCPNY